LRPHKQPKRIKSVCLKSFRKEIDFAGKKIILETGKIARQADGAVMATMGGTSVLCTAVAAKSVKDGQDFFPLTVHYLEKFYAAGRIPGGFFKARNQAFGRQKR
jgi:polyribonucleotide nucleotidyltransferase